MTRALGWDGLRPDDIPDEKPLERALERWQDRLLVRWMSTLYDMPQVSVIESGQENIAWSEEQYVKILEQGDIVRKVIQDQMTNEIFGSMVYDLTKDGEHKTIIIEHFVVAASKKGMDVEFYMLDHLLRSVADTYSYEYIRMCVDIGDLSMIDILLRAGFSKTPNYKSNKTPKDKIWFGRKVPLKKT